MEMYLTDSKPSHSMNPRDIVNQNWNKMIFQSCSWLIWHLAWCLSCLQVCYLIHYNRLYSIRYSYIQPSSHWVRDPWVIPENLLRIEVCWRRFRSFWYTDISFFPNHLYLKSRRILHSAIKNLFLMRHLLSD